MKTSVARRLRGAYELVHRGQQVLARMEYNGIRVDMEYLEKVERETDEKIRSLTAALRGDPVFASWHRRYGTHKTNLGSREQLGEVIFKVLGYSSDSRTATGRYKTEEEDFKGVDLPFVKTYFALERLKKLKGTYLKGIRDEVVDGFVHPVINLHLASSYRSTEDSPNLQNIPARNPEVANIIRRCYIARPGCRLVEMDYGTLEARVAACVSKDPMLLKYMRDPSTDMHRDTAADLFCMSVEFLKEHKDWAKRTVRDWSKNRFVFPEFFGSVWFQCAPDLWDGVASGAKMPDGEQTIEEYLREQGIKHACKCEVKKDRGKPVHENPKPGTFCHHVQEAERIFWNERFPHYTQWKKETWDDYQKCGYVDLVTGFRCEEILKRNELYNRPIQGPAFHLLLMALGTIQDDLDRRRMKTLMINEIHDCAIADVPEEELQDYLHLAREVMAERVPKMNSWVICPMEVTAEVTPLNGSWVDKKEWSLKDGKWAGK